VIKGGTVVDGTGSVPRTADGQAAWAEELDPAFSNGVTSLVMGNCGAGFAPCPAGEQQTLIERMEGVEDIAGAALHERVRWRASESLPEHLDFLDQRSYSLDIGAQLVHGALRFHVMGDRGVGNEDATEADVAAMRELSRQAIAGGAIGFSTSRPIGLLSSLGGCHAFMRRRSYLTIAHLPVVERAQQMRDPVLGARVLRDGDVPPENPGSMDALYEALQMRIPDVYRMAPVVDYEPTMLNSFIEIGVSQRKTPEEAAYDGLCEGDGTNVAIMLGAGYVDRTLDAIREMLVHPDTITGLGDAGAYVRLIREGSMPSIQITHWSRDRTRGEQIRIEFLVEKQTRRHARLYGLDDRGTLENGLRADLNVIAFDNLQVRRPVTTADLPAGGVRFL
jgi:N-acyl-D-aspartate/D-glutamate deacylase